MSVTSETGRDTGQQPRPSSNRASPGWIAYRAAIVRRAMERPLTSYYLLLGGSTLLLAIGLMMVLSASSVYGYRVHDSSYYIFLKQLTWVVIGLPVAWLASRMNRTAAAAARVARRAGRGRRCSCLTQTGLGFAVNGNRNWLALGPLTVQPSEIAKLADHPVGAPTSTPRRSGYLGSPWHALIPVAPVVAHDLGPGRLPARPRHRAGAVRDPARDALGGRRPGAAVRDRARPWSGWWRSTSRPRNAERRTRLTSFIDPFKDFQGAGWQAGHGLLGMSSGGIFGKGLGASQQKWGNLPEAHTDFIFAVLGEELGLVGTLLVLGALRRHRPTPAIRIAINTDGPVRPLRRRRVSRSG